jgi:hypothetical protein
MQINLWQSPEHNLESQFLLLGVDVWEKKVSRTPLDCPNCKKNTLHVFFHTFGKKKRSASTWIWCSNCFLFVHLTMLNPPSWVNYLDNTENLNVPYLNSILDKIDEHVSEYLNSS